MKLVQRYQMGRKCNNVMHTANVVTVITVKLNNMMSHLHSQQTYCDQYGNN
jgi:hypothetical protein